MKVNNWVERHLIDDVMIKHSPDPPAPKDLAESIATSRLSGNDINKRREDRHFGIHITRDGTWHYQGSPIKRMALVKLFATVISRDPKGEFWLVTPVERGRIDVDDAPFVAVEVKVKGSGRATRLTFRTNLDDEIVASNEHPIRIEVNLLSEEPSPYIHVRDNLEALIARSVYYELVELAEQVALENEVELQIWSEGKMFCLGKVPLEE